MLEAKLEYRKSPMSGYTPTPSPLAINSENTATYWKGKYYFRTSKCYQIKRPNSPPPLKGKSFRNSKFVLTSPPPPGSGPERLVFVGFLYLCDLWVIFEHMGLTSLPPIVGDAKWLSRGEGR